MNVMLSTLHLVYPPVSSYEADAAKEDPEVEALLRTSDFYMMAMRPEVFVDEIEFDGAMWTVRVTGETPDGQPFVDHVTLDVERLATDTLGEMPETAWAEIGPKLIRLWPGTEADAEAGLVDP